MKKFNLIIRIVFGLVFLVFGLNGFLHFLELPDLPEAAGKFIGALANSGYLMQTVKGIEVFSGFLILIGVFVPFALVIITPITINIFLFHLFLAPGLEGMILPSALLVINLYLGLVVYVNRFKEVLKP